MSSIQLETGTDDNIWKNVTNCHEKNISIETRKKKKNKK